jgi:nitroimidazol reductase NimA-like FMN-containing flavoprotein (pyridoxamine 5'-phosphate oxidase superfamily)
LTVPRELSRDECTALLGAGSVGRVALCSADGPHIVPVNYVLDGESVIFRTSAYSMLGQHDWSSAVVAFEVDELDPENRSGRSVVVRGPAERIEDADEVDSIAWTTDPSPWAGGLRRQYVRVRFSEMTGRAVGEDTSGQER